MADAMCSGIKGSDDFYLLGQTVTKHYFGYQAEWNRSTSSNYLTNRTLRDEQCKGFYDAEKSGNAVGVMTSFGGTNGIPNALGLLSYEIADPSPYHTFSISDFNVYYELLGKADEIAKGKDWEVASVLIGADVSAAAEEIREHTDKIYKAESYLLKDHTLEKYALVMEALIREYEPEMVLVGASSIGSELAPTTAGKVRTGLAAHAIDIAVDNDRDRINCMVPAFGGKVVSEIYIPEARPMMASIRPGILDRACVSRECHEIQVLDTSFLENYEAKEEFLEYTPEVVTGVKLEETNVV